MSACDVAGKRADIGAPAATVEALGDQAVQSRLTDFGYDIFPREQQSPEAVGALVKADAKKWWPLIKEFGIRAE